jgi:hypothetical protein
MTEVATFFRHREQDPGETYRVDVRTDKLLYQFSIYSRNPVEIRTNEADRAADNRECEAIFKDLRQKVATEGRGGLIVTTVYQGSRAQLGVTRVGGESFQPPQQFVVLAPGRPPSFFSTDKRETELFPGAHAIVPVDADAEERLRSFIGHLEWLPRDLESLALAAIRRPSLDARLTRVETRLFGHVSKGQETATDDWVTKLKQWLWNPTFYRWAAVALVLLLLGVNTVLLLTRLPDPDPEKKAEVPVEPTPVGPSPSPSPPEPTPVPSTVLGASLRDLFGKLRSSSDENLRLLYRVHFADLDTPSLSDAQVSTLFRERGPQERGAGTRPFLLGLIKLQALKLDPNPRDPTFLNEWENITGTKARFSEIGTDAIGGDREGQRLLSALACRLRYNDKQAPELMETGTAAVKFSERPCQEFTEEDITEGLKNLIDFVENPSGRGGFFGG